MPLADRSHGRAKHHAAGNRAAAQCGGGKTYAYRIDDLCPYAPGEDAQYAATRHHAMHGRRMRHISGYEAAAITAG